MAASLSILLAAIVMVAFVVESSSMTRGERTMGSGVAYRVAGDLGMKIDAYLAAGRSLAIAIERNPDMGEAQSEAIAEGILAGNPGIIGVSIAPGAIINRYYPAQEGLTWKGHDLLSNPGRKDALLKAVELKTPVVTGPFESVDGSSSLFLRYPVYSGGKVWGFSSLTLDFPRLLESLGLEERFPGILFALADFSQPKLPHFLGGKEMAMSGKGASAELSRQGILWKIYAAPSSGWADSSPFFYILLASGLLAAVFLYLLLARRGTIPRLAADPAIAGTEPPESPTHQDELRAMPEAGPKHPKLAESSTGILPDLSIVARKRGRAIAFRGQEVKGDLFMPEHLLADCGDPGSRQADSQPEPAAIPEPASETEPLQEPECVLPVPAPPEPEAAEPVFLPSSSARTVPAQVPTEEKNVQRRAGYLFAFEEEKPAHDLSILVVDDSEANRDIMGRMLSLRGYKADFAASGAEAIQLAASRFYKVVFMDSYMPGMDGQAATRALRAAGLSSGSFIVGMSAKIGEQELGKCRESGMDDLLAKPFTLKQLLVFLEKAGK